MAERQLDVETMLSGLNDIRLPADAPGGLVAELLVAIGFGLALAWLVSLLVTARHKAAVVVPTLEAKIATLHPLPEAERSVALMHLARSEGITLPETAALYEAGGFPTSDEIETRLRDGQAKHA